ncbi:hypothetical protein [Streptomyces iakyrus]|uniref:hypothetical protein n=1 Tax=Streptomyces iakyrus TaxID=68219 RepID=UPI0036A27EDA
MSAPCTRPECGGEVHTDGWGTPIQCPAARRCPRCDCPDGAAQCDHCKVCPHATIPAHLCPQVHRVPHDAHDGCPGWMPDDGTRPEAPPAPTPLEEAQATVEGLRLRRAREALAEDETNDAEAAVARVRALHTNGSGLCDECTGSHGVPWPCATIRALDGEAT